MKQSAQCLRLILGDQLNPEYRWFKQVDADIVYLMFEMRQETDYVIHHAQKVVSIFAAMRQFSTSLQRAGHRVHYVRIDEPAAAKPLTQLLSQALREYQASSLEWQEPDEWRLDHQLRAWASQQTVTTRVLLADHYLTTRQAVGDFFEQRKHWLMETFYRRMRRTHQILIDTDGQPLGGQWNYDRQNRRSWPGTPRPLPERLNAHDHRPIWQSIQAAGVKTFGAAPTAQSPWPIDRHEALKQLHRFITERLFYFGDYEDAMSTLEPRLFHSQLSFALNTKMLGPLEVIQTAVEAAAQHQLPLAAIEGFVRQILGWREFVRGVYWAKMPDYAQLNRLNQSGALPQWFWTGETKMRCLSYCLQQSLHHTYAHHIQRLMVIGNFSLLAGLNPQEVHQWYLGVYIDAFEWVSLPNTLGMSQFADGGLFATKPYVSSASYIHRMSDYCRGCYYSKQEKVGERACPFNSLYWDFYSRHALTFRHNPRVALVYRQLDKMSSSTVREFRQQAAQYCDNLDAC